MQVVCTEMRILQDQMDHKIGATYLVLFCSQYGIWTIYPSKGHVVLEDETPAAHNPAPLPNCCVQPSVHPVDLDIEP